MADLLKKKNAGELEAPSPQNDKKAKKIKPQYLKQKSMNFLERYETVVEGKKSGLDIDKFRKPYLTVLTILLVIFVIIEALFIFTKLQVKSYEKYLNNPSNISAYNKAVSVRDKTEKVKTERSNMESLINAIASYPKVNAAFLGTLSSTASANGITLSTYGYTAQTGLVSIPCSAPAPSNISAFIRAVEATGLFANVEYNGFTGGREAGYSFVLSCYCAENK